MFINQKKESCVHAISIMTSIISHSMKTDIVKKISNQTQYNHPKAFSLTPTWNNWVIVGNHFAFFHIRHVFLVVAQHKVSSKVGYRLDIYASVKQKLFNYAPTMNPNWIQTRAIQYQHLGYFSTTSILDKSLTIMNCSWILKARSWIAQQQG